MSETSLQPKSEPRSRSWLIFLPFLLFAAVALLFFVRLFAGDVTRLPSALIGKQVPQFVLPPVTGLASRPGLSDQDMKQGGVTILNVFASWCVPCHQEAAFLLALAEDDHLAEEGVRIYGLAYKDSAENIRRFLNESGDPFARVGLDELGRTAIDFGVYGVPETFIVKGDGTIAFKYVGPLSQDVLRDTILPEIEKARR
ncbi:MAG TPA: DsbE family thiol:disulfide interchange protein [Methylovirgula sp.]|nr:DsbE family thiol:disulfide interchange protein [Methylovirgula sp.]